DYRSRKVSRGRPFTHSILFQFLEKRHIRSKQLAVVQRPSLLNLPTPAPAAARELAMNRDILNALFLCTGNSARSIMAEAILNSIGKGRFRAYSAGSRPTGTVNLFALELLERNRLATSWLRSKDWNEFSKPDAPFMHFVFTV